MTGSETQRRTAIVTGGSAGIGHAIAAELIAADHDVTLAARSAERCSRVAAELASADTAGPSAVGALYDAGEPGSGVRLVEDHLGRFRRLDVLVVNAGTGRSGGVVDTRGEILRELFEVNVAAAFELVRAALPPLRESASTGGWPWVIVNASVSGLDPTPNFAAYSATKAAAISLARSVECEEIATGVRACAVCPAFVDTEMSAWAHDRVPPAAMLSPGDVAAAVRFLLSLSSRVSVPVLPLGRRGAPPGRP